MILKFPQFHPFPRPPVHSPCSMDRVDERRGRHVKCAFQTNWTGNATRKGSLYAVRD